MPACRARFSELDEERSKPHLERADSYMANGSTAPSQPVCTDVNQSAGWTAPAPVAHHRRAAEGGSE